MQSNGFLAVLARLSNKKFGFWAKISVFAGMLAYIGFTVRQQPVGWGELNQYARATEDAGWKLALLVGVLPLNWGLEALKWQLLVRRLLPITFLEACRGVLAGVTMGFAMPAQLGDTAGRLLALPMRRTEAVGASVVSGGVQYYASLLFGTVAWAGQLHLHTRIDTPAGWWAMGALLTLCAAGVVVGVYRKSLINWLTDRNWLRRLTRVWAVVGHYTQAELAVVLLIALARYLVFLGQFYLAFRMVGVDLPARVILSGIGLVLLIKTLAPAFNLLSDFGIREAAALWVFVPMGVPAPLVLTATVLVWFTNVLTPVLVGLTWSGRRMFSRA